MCATTIGGNFFTQQVFKLSRIVSVGAECDQLPISNSGVEDLRRLLLRTLNDNQLLILKRISSNRRSLTSILKSLSNETGIPLSTLKLNARILRELNLISYGSIRDTRLAEIEPLGYMVIRLIEIPIKARISFIE
jgi:hypothetical protein